MTRTAAVVGGGIGGLTTAIGLLAAGWQVTVYERGQALPPTGTGLGIWPSALRALDALGVGAAVRAVGRPQGDGAIRRPDGRPIVPLDMDRIRAKHGEPVHLVPRPALLRALHDALPTGTVRFGSPVEDITALRADHDVVIGADGIGSRVRAALLGDRHGLRYAGATVWRGTADLDISTGGETWGSGARFGVTPQGPGRTNWYAVLTVPENHRFSRPDADELRRHFGDWHDPIPAVLDRYATSDVIRHDLYHLAPALPSYVLGNVALLGDAAHAMTPDLGQGACQAIIDGAALAECLSGAEVADGLLAYDRLRRRPTQRMAAASLMVNRLAQARRWHFVRDTAMRLALSFGPPA
ncbi:FAD-dependent monooxygenase [Catellatospora sp. KI3]|uniref:FAD-dependent monooxygenase n=1 Tax=Catellatospora sp. KI3 TaxID=3041620 RepID=UPI0024821901|nr:FAD-dependent monooxygenase [Catellatospora sp. KI3]MDI1462644.1 FAD-dependent monooxygenase [Catellatospora sp. KI3]